MATSEQPGGTHECPTCDRAFDTDRGMKIHHAQSHGERLALVTSTCDHCGEEYEEMESKVGAYCSNECKHRGQGDPMVTKECQQCGEQFETSKYRAENEPAKFCSKSCAASSRTGERHSRWRGGAPVCECELCGDEFEGHRGNPNRFCSPGCRDAALGEERSGENHPMWNGGPIPHTCEWCGGEFTAAAGSTNPNRFCSTSCKNDWQSEAYSGEGHPQYNQVAVECDTCGAEFTKPPSRHERSQHHYCSPECHYQDYGGATDRLYYGPNWQTQREKARIRDQCRCVGCGMTDPEHLRKYGKTLTVHHVKKIRKFAERGGDVDYESANQLDNLLTGCWECHTKWEQMAPLRPDTQASADD